jgi:hypothetical protein
MTLRHPRTVPDLAAAHAYLAAKAALATGGEPETGCRRSLEQRRTGPAKNHAPTHGRHDDPHASQQASEPAGQSANREDYCDQR